MKSIFKTFVLSVLVFAQVHFAFAQTASILPPAKTTFLDQNGKPLVNGTVDFYIPSTTTRKTTWQDAAETTPNANPLTLDPSGRALILGSGSYRQVVKDRNGNTIWDQVTSSTGSGSSVSPTATGDGDLVGTIKPWAGLTAPNQYMLTNGQEISRSTYSALFTAITSSQSIFCNTGSATLSGLSDTTSFWIGMTVEVSCVAAGFSTIVSKTASSVTLAANANVTVNATATFFPWGRGNGTTTFNLPDFRGFAIAGNNNMGGVANSVLTTAFFGATNPNSIGAAGGSQSVTLLAANIPPLSTTVSVTSIDTNILKGTINSNSFNFTSGGGSILAALNSVTAGSVTSNGSGVSVGTLSTPFSTVQPTKTSNYIIKTTPDSNSATASGVTSIGSMTGDIACGTGLTCSGNIISSNSTAASVNFTQTGTGAQQITLDAIYRGKVYTPEMFSSAAISAPLGTVSASVPNATTAINAAISALCAIGGGTVLLGPGAYGVNGVNITCNNIFIRGSGVNATTLVHQMSAPSSAVVFSAGASVLSNTGISDLAIGSSDTVFNKIAINVNDISHFYARNVNVAHYPVDGTLYRGSGGSGTALFIQGREHGVIENFQTYAEQPIHIAINPNSSISIDSWVFRNLVLVGQLSTATFHLITIDPNVNLFNTTFDGHQNWIGGVDGIHWVDASSTQVSLGLYISGVKSEQSGVAGASGYVVDIQHNTALDGLKLDGMVGGDRALVKLRKVTTATLYNSYFDPTSGVGTNTVGYDVDGTVASFTVTKALWTNVGGRATTNVVAAQNILKQGPTPTGFSSTVPSDIEYTTATPTVTFVAVAANSFNGAAVDNLAWSTYTPTLSCGTGTLTSASATGRYKQIGRTVFIEVNVTITTNGTCATSLKASVPVTAATNFYAMSMVDKTSAASGSANISGGSPTSDPVNIRMFTVAGAYPTGFNPVVTGVYEVP